MANVLVYTKKGEKYYCNDGYPGLTALNCDLDDSMHLALSRDGKTFLPMRNNTGILFPKADFSGERPGGTTKTLLYPWIFRFKDGSAGVCAVRRNQNEPDSSGIGCVMVFRSENLVHYEEMCFLKLGTYEIKHPRCRFEEEKRAYYLEWETKEGIFCGYTRYFKEIADVKPKKAFSMLPAEDYGIPGAVPGNCMEISEEEADFVEGYLGEIYHTGVAELKIETQVGKAVDFSELPECTCLYSDGSTHDKAVDWDREAYQRIDFAKPGIYEIWGDVRQKRYPFPFLDADISDPCICYYQGRFFLSASGQRSVVFRISDTLEGLTKADPVAVYTIPETDQVHTNMWAQEMHIIHGIPYVFTTVGEKDWFTVRSHVLRCSGDPANPEDWEAPRLVLKPDGTELREGGISLDMTCFCVDGVHYVMWSDRGFRTRGAEGVEAESADIYIATIDPDAPWQLTTNPVCILRPMYGWDRCQTEVDEGPYLLRHGDDLFVTISGSSTGLADLYCLGLLHARRGNNLLSPDGWEWLPYPVLTKESVPGEYGPGHNCFLKDQETGDDLLIYHAVPHDETGRAKGRHMGIRRVHWAANGYPYLEMTAQRDLNPAWKRVTLKIEVR